MRTTTVGLVLSGLLAAMIMEWSWTPARAADSSANDEWTAPARAARKKNPIAADEKSLAAGKAVYVKECASCHGETGKGDGSAAKDLNPKPRDLRVPKMWEQTDGSLFWKLTEGKKPMPSYDKLLSEDDRWHVINYTRSTYAPKGSSATTQPK
ncbi:MAG: cytochrome c [Tepidisphaeraceae bacterium]